MCYFALSHALLITFEWVEYSYHKIIKIFSINILLNLIWVYWSFGNKKTVFWFNNKKEFFHVPWMVVHPVRIPSI